MLNVERINMLISATIITLNEEGVLEQCLKNVKPVVDEIILVDSGSADRTVEIAQRFTDKVFVNKFKDFADQKNFAASLATNEWILNIDADELLSEELKSRILQLKSSAELRPKAFCFPRKTFRDDGSLVFNIVSYPGFHYRLYNRSFCRWLYPVHETLEVRGKRKFLPEHLLHYPNFQRVPDKEELYNRLKQENRSIKNKSSFFQMIDSSWFHFRALFIDLSFYRKGWTYWKHGAQILLHLAGLRLKQNR